MTTPTGGMPENGMTTPTGGMPKGGMTEEELHALLDELEAGLRADVTAALSLVADEFAGSLDTATELVAARFSVSRIRDMWRRRVPAVMTRLRGIGRRSARTVADDLGEPLPGGWDTALSGYTEATQALLDAVGDRLADAAVRALEEGETAGDTVGELKARLAAVFADDAAQLGPGRAERIAMTEATRAWNAGALAAAQALTGPDRPLVKQWLTRNDTRVREPHADANGQLQLLDDPFQVGGTDMQYPGDPVAPAALTVNCRCIMRVSAPALTEGDDVSAAAGGGAEEFQSRMPEQLKRYWLGGEGAAKIRWGTPGSFDRCVSNLRDDFPENTEGLCANLYHEATGRWPGEDRDKSGGEVHTGAMLALMPTVEDAARLALDGYESADQLHLTLFYLGKGADWSDAQRGDLISRVASAARYLRPVHGNVFGGAQWNPQSDEPSWVWNVGDVHDSDGSTLEGAHYEIAYALEGAPDTPELPQQHTPWSPHICAGYTTDVLHESLAGKTGPVTFDRIRVAFAGSYTDIPLTGAAFTEPDDVDVLDEAAYADTVVLDPAPTTLEWSTPAPAALAFEDQQTGDGRVFMPGSLSWSGPGPWPLQYAEEMRGGHDGAELAGAIYSMDRVGGRITGSGVLYLTTAAGTEAAMLLAQWAPIGVSVDLDDVDLEMIDNTGGEEVAYSARLLTASLLPLPDGGWQLDGETEAELFASGAGSIATEHRKVSFLVGPDGRVPAGVFELEAAAGDVDNAAGVVVDRQSSGDYLMRITRARIRGATLVTIPAYADARIVLTDQTLSATAVTPVADAVSLAASAATSDYDRVVRHVRKSAGPVSPADAAKFLKLSIVAVRRHLARAARKGDLVRVSRARYVGPVELDRTDAATAVSASATAVADAETATATGVADDTEELFASLVEDGDMEGSREELEASAWTAMKDLPPMPAAWFAEPTAAELPPGGPGVNYEGGRVFGWVAQAGEPHAGFAKKITIDGLGRIDTSHFLRQRFTLDDGSTVKAGAYTMNAGHHRDGAECETSACQFDDSRTVAAIVTVGMNERGMWFSGAAAPWISEWDRRVFLATQPSYHMKKGPAGNWQLRAVLSVPVPGHSSPLLASAVVERSQLALTAAATMAEVEEVVAAENERQEAEQTSSAPDAVAMAAGIDYDRLADALVASMARAEQRRAEEAAELQALIAEGRTMDGDDTGTEGD